MRAARSSSSSSRGESHGVRFEYPTEIIWKPPGSCTTRWSGVMTEELGVILPMLLLDDRDDHLAGDVASEQDGVHAVELGRVQELAETPVRPMDVGRKEDLRFFQTGRSSSSSRVMRALRGWRGEWSGNARPWPPRWGSCRTSCLPAWPGESRPGQAAGTR